MNRRLLSLALLLTVLSFASAAKAQGRFASSMGGYGWGASSTADAGQAVGNGQSGSPQVVSPMWGLFGQTAQAGQTGAPTTGSSSTVDDFWSLMPMFQLFGL